MEKLKIEAIKTDIGYFVKATGWNNYAGTVLINFLFDGVLPQKTWNNQYIKIPNIPKFL